MDIETWVEERGYVGPIDLADEIDVDVRAIRAWCEENDVPVVGRQYIIDPETAGEIADDLLDEEEEDEEEDERECDVDVNCNER